MVLLKGILGFFSKITRNPMSALFFINLLHWDSESSEHWIKFDTPPVYKPFKTKGEVPNVWARSLYLPSLSLFFAFRICHQCNLVSCPCLCFERFWKNKFLLVLSFCDAYFYSYLNEQRNQLGCGDMREDWLWNPAEGELAKVMTSTYIVDWNRNNRK